MAGNSMLLSTNLIEKSVCDICDKRIPIKSQVESLKVLSKLYNNFPVAFQTHPSKAQK